MEDVLNVKQEAPVTMCKWVLRAFSAVKKLVVARKVEAVCAVLLMVMAANLFAAISRKTLTTDEIVHIPAGYYHLVLGNFQFNNEHPPLIKMWAALPLLLVQPNEPVPINRLDEKQMESTWLSYQSFWEMNSERYASITFWPRMMMIPIALALGALIFVFARKLFGDTAAIIAVGLYVLEPTVLAHGRVVHTDIPAAFVYLLFFFTLHYYAEAPGLTRAVLLGLVCGVALLTKFSMVVIVPVLIVFLAIRFWIVRRKNGQRSQVLLHAALVTVVILLLVNVVYYFTHPALEAHELRLVELKSAPRSFEILSGLRVLSNVIPTYYLFGLYNVVIHSRFGHATSLLGQYNDLGWWYYFPVAFALKTTIPFLVLAVAAMAWATWSLVAKRKLLFLLLVVPVGLYTAISMTSHVNIGIRHFLPVFPLLFIAGGAFAAHILRQKKRLAAVVLVILIGWMGFEAARTFPHYTPYMNQLASGRPHWYYLSDSNVEWGDDVGELAAYLKARGEIRVSAAIHGLNTLTHYGVEALDLTSGPPQMTPETRYVAIGASFLNGSVVPGDDNVIGRRSFERTDLFAPYRNRKPEAVFGNSIYLYRNRE